MKDNFAILTDVQLIEKREEYLKEILSLREDVIKKTEQWEKLTHEMIEVETEMLKRKKK